MKDYVIYEDYFFQVNGSNYKHSDNRTHIDPILDYNPKTDMRYRKTVAKSQNSSGSCRNKHMTLTGFYIVAGTGTVESNVNSFTPVIYFPTSKDINMVLIKSLEFRTVYPKSIIERFQMVERSEEGKIKLEDAVQTYHSKNIYFCSKTEKFVAFFDERLVNDLSESALSKIIPKSSDVSYNFVRDKKNNKKTYLGIFSKDINTLKKHLESSKEYLDFLDSYCNLFLDFTKGQKVILLKYLHNDSEKTNSVLNSLFERFKELPPNFSTVFMQVEFFSAVKFGKYAYIFNEDGTVNPNNCIYINDNDTRIHEFKENKFDKLSSQVSLGKEVSVYSIMPYSDEDFNLLLNIKSKISEAADMLNSLFVSGKNEKGLLDKPISSLNIDSIKLLK